MSKDSRPLVLQLIGKVECCPCVPPQDFVACSSQLNRNVCLYHPLEIRGTRFDAVQRRVLRGVKYGLRQWSTFAQPVGSSNMPGVEDPPRCNRSINGSYNSEGWFIKCQVCARSKMSGIPPAAQR